MENIKFILILISVVVGLIALWKIIRVERMMITSQQVDDYDPDEEDELYEDVKEFVSEAGKCSASLIQRKFKIGYARAAKLMDMLEEDGVVGE